jgi:glutamyl-tRNA synthetase
MKLRFAPSPTGLLHVGNARVALLNYLMARKGQGRFLLRLDDTDQERSSAAFAEAIKHDLTWLGISWDEEAVQSQRMDRYEAAADKLKAAGRLYPCYETPEELSLKRKVALQTGRPPIYDRAALELNDEERARLEAHGRRPHWRFKLLHQEIAWDDLVRGAVSFQGENIADPVLIREDGRPLYTLTSVVDDGELNMTCVLRGEDHVTNTATQVQLFEALGFAVPQFGHLPLLTDAAGKGLSKRLGSLSLEALRDEGLEAMAINSYLAKLGTPDPIEARPEIADLVADFDISRFGRATPRFDPEELTHLNARVLHALPFEAVAARLPEGFDKALWAVVRPNLTRLEDALIWFEIVRGKTLPRVEEPEFSHLAASLLPEEPWDETTWGTWTAAIKEASGRKGKALFLPLRLALTGLDHGPELKFLLPLLGRARALACLGTENDQESTG